MSNIRNFFPAKIFLKFFNPKVPPLFSVIILKSDFYQITNITSYAENTLGD